MVRQMVMGWVVILGSLGWVGGAVYYVDDSAPGANNGTSWANAFVYLQDALSVVAPDDLICVAQGTYRPDQSAYLDGLIHGDQKASFNLKGDFLLRRGYG